MSDKTKINIQSTRMLCDESCREHPLLSSCLIYMLKTKIYKYVLIYIFKYNENTNKIEKIQRVYLPVFA